MIGPLYAAEVAAGRFQLTGSGRSTSVGDISRLLQVVEAARLAMTLVVLVLDPWPNLPEVDGWEAGPEALGWRTYRGGRRLNTVHVGLAAALPVDRHPYAKPGGAWLLRHWALDVGTPWHGTPGVAGTDALRATLEARIPAGDVVVRPDLRRDHQKAVERVWVAGLERDYVPTDWRETSQQDGPTITLDANMAYLSAALTAELPRTTLRRSKGRGPTSHVGYHLADIAPWMWTTALPDPAGYLSGNAPRRRDGLRWITTPTLRLLEELRDQGVHGGVSVEETWSAPAARVTRAWAETLRNVIATRNDSPELVAMSKAAYRETIGLMGRPGGRIYRPDWQSIIVAQSRVTLWRKLHRAWTAGAVPVSVNVDAVTFAGTTPPPQLKVAAGQLGAFKIKADQ